MHIMRRVELALAAPDRVDCRDEFGKWGKAEVRRAEVEVKAGGTVVRRVFVHWTEMETEEWDEWVEAGHPVFAQHDSFTNPYLPCDPLFARGSKVLALSPLTGTWQRGVIGRVDGSQVRVLFDKYAYWYSVLSHDIVLDDQHDSINVL